MRIIVTGGRDYYDFEAVETALNIMQRRFGALTIIHGGASGADTLAAGWAFGKDSVTVISIPADWDDISAPGAVVRTRKNGTPYNAAAGPARNQRMIDDHKPDLVLAFPGNRGTDDMKRRAKSAGIRVVNHYDVFDEGEEY